jgi:hypothetical protein
MTAILFDSTVFRKSDQTFARGLHATRTATFEPTPTDRAWAAAEFDHDALDRHIEEQARQAEWDAQFRFPAGLCELCGEPSDWLDPVHKLCGECLTAAENATIAGQNRSAMGQYRVF